jgi:type I restriction enzyme R subunit
VDDGPPGGDRVEGLDEGGGDGGGGKDDDDDDGKRKKYVVGDVPVFVVNERVQYYGKDGKLITESLRDYTRNAVREELESLDAFLKQWAEADRREALLAELQERGVFFDELAKEIGKDLSPFDLVCRR